MDSAIGCKRVHPDDHKAEDECYLKKIKNLVTKKMKLLADQCQEETSEKKKKINSKPLMPIASIQSLKEFITNEMNGKDLTLVINKIMYISDLAKNQNRLSMPMNQLETQEFLTEKEKKNLEKGGEFDVELVGPRLELHRNPMVMKMWRLKTSNSYVLRTYWNEYLKENDGVLTEGTKIQVWSFRVDEKLCFALACV